MILGRSGLGAAAATDTAAPAPAAVVLCASSCMRLELDGVFRMNTSFLDDEAPASIGIGIGVGAVPRGVWDSPASVEVRPVLREWAVECDCEMGPLLLTTVVPGL